MQTAPSARRGSKTRLTNSIGGRLSTATSSWSGTIFDPGQNAISTLLQPPIVPAGLGPHTFAPASSLYNTPTARNIPPVTLTNVQHVEAAEFEPYTSQVDALYKQLQRVQDGEVETRLKQEIRPDNFPKDNGDFDEAGGRSLSGRKGSVASIASMNSTIEDLRHRQGTIPLSRRVDYGSSSLSLIPSVYFDQKFRLENPRTFRVVSEHSEILPPNPTTERSSNESVEEPRKALATNAILQEKLSWYMDIVEVHLIESISMTSVTISSALDSLRELYSEASTLVQNIKTLRKDFVALDESIVIGGLELLQKRYIRHNLQQMQDAIEQSKRVVDGVTYAEVLIDNGEAEKALTEIDTIEQLIIGERDETLGDKASPDPRFRNLRGVVLLQGVVSDLDILRLRIGKVFEAQLHNLLIEDLRRHVQSISTQEVLSRWMASSLRAKGASARNSSIFPAYMCMIDELRMTLSLSISGLYRSKFLSTAIVAYRELVLQEIRSIVRKPLPSLAIDTESVTLTSAVGEGRIRTNQARFSILARNLRALDAEDAEELLSIIFTSVTEALRRVKTQSSVLLDIIYSIGYTDTEEIHSEFDISNLLEQAINASHDKINKILRIRSEQSRSLPLASFLRYFTLNLLFSNECESITGQTGTSLKTLVNSHIQDWITGHEELESKTLVQGMNCDDWQDKDFTAKDNEILEQVLQCSTADPPEWNELNKILASIPQGEAESTSIADSTVKDKFRGATIDEETFLLPSSAILCLEGISRFLRLIGGIPTMTPDITMSLITYLQLFDSRCRQLVLGAGAMRSVGLRNITTTHLVVALQAVSFIATVIPHVREFVRRHVPGGRPSSNLTGEFDKVQRALQEHQECIYEKLIEIMTLRARIHSRKANAIKWDKEKAENVRGYMADLTRDIAKLHRALSKRRPPWVVTRVMMPVFTNYKEQLENVFEEADAMTKAGRDCMLRDVDYLIDKLGDIKGFGDLGAFLRKVIEEKETYDS